MTWFLFFDIAADIKAIIKRIRKPADEVFEVIFRWLRKKVNGLRKKGKGKDEKKETKEESKKDMKEGKDNKLTKKDKAMHRKYAEEIVKKIESLKPDSKDKSLKDKYTQKKQQAKFLEEQYQKKLKKGIKVSITLEPFNKVKTDHDIKFKIKIAPNTTYANGTITFSGALLTPTEEATLKGYPGGTELVNHIQTLHAAVSDKLANALAEARTGLDTISRGLSVIFIGGSVEKGKSANVHFGGTSGITMQTEIDVFSSEEMIEVKGGGYLKKKKLQGRDMDQFTAQKRIFEGKTKIIHNGNILPAPKRWIYQFSEPSINEDLYNWLIKKGVTEVRTGK